MQHKRKQKINPEPNDSNITADGFPNFTHEEIHVGTAHTNAYDRYGCTLEATCDG